MQRQIFVPYDNAMVEDTTNEFTELHKMWQNV